MSKMYKCTCYMFFFFFLTCWLCRLFCRVKAFSSPFSPSKIKKDLSLSCTFPQSHTSLSCQFSAQGVHLQLLLFCNGYYYFKWCAFILTSWPYVSRIYAFLDVHNASGTGRTTPIQSIIVWILITTDSREQTEWSLYFWLNNCFTVCITGYPYVTYLTL